ncbi:hypothetical protein [Natronorubrum texcoconense]|uniref:Uncharacterized protein n=1 Tax=Natronorubrum texcoconense TaxID=1095776 RepID=A0A1G9B3R9_9EURY|nr:hypothetical protein [Natronorubrum texcoconense]SDK34143.1 hypothetical protein SAMN04515672_2809 [Natronorubrum texcoconense]
MRALRSCDFCDGEAVGTFEVLPPELEPTETEQRRIVLCVGCRDQFENLLEPLLARAGVGETSQTVGTDETATSTDGDSGTVVASANESTQRASSPNATVSGSDADEADETDGANGADNTDDEDGADGMDNTDAADDTNEADTDGSATKSTLEDGITFERAETAAESNEATDEETATDASSGTDGEESDTTAGGSTAQRTANRPPKAYGKVIRLLQNREFPMPRAAVENLAAGAYDLESHEVEAVVDHALEEGEFVESRDLLERP